jgi:WD40 repeat protein
MEKFGCGTQQIQSPPSPPFRLNLLTTPFILAFSPDKSLAAAADFLDTVATIFDLKSGDPRLIIDTGMEIYGLGVTTNNVIVIGNEKIVTWDLPAGDCVLDARANVHDSVRTIVFDPPVPPHGQSDTASISPDFNYVAIVLDTHLEIYDISTGKRLVGTKRRDLRQPVVYSGRTRSLVLRGRVENHQKWKI